MDKQAAEASLNAAENSPRRLLAIHSGVLAGCTLVLSLISFLLNETIQPAGGLGSMDLQALLSTAQVGMQLIQSLLTPFWVAGMYYAAIGIARRRPTGPKDLIAGFYKILPLLSANAMIFLQYLARLFLSAFLSVQLLLFTPAGAKLYQASMKPEAATMELDVLLGNDFLPVMITLFAIYLLVFAVLALPVFYRYRMTTWLIMDDQDPGGLRAMFHSRLLMLRRRWDLAKLDLSFWWYYLLLGLGVVLCYGSLIFAAAGLTLPVSETVAYWIFLVLGLAVQFLVKSFAGPKVMVTYAHRYERYLTELPPARKKKQVVSTDLPWEY